MAAGVYSSIFIATPLLVHLKSRETEVVQAEKRERGPAPARRPTGTPSVPAFTEDHAGPGRARATTPTTTGAARRPSRRRPRRPARAEASGRGRVAPPPQRPVAPSSASGRQQPTRQPRSKRGKK